MLVEDIKKILVSKEEIEEICYRLGTKISEDYSDKSPVFIGLLKGCQPFMSDLMKHFTNYCEIDYMKVSSYHGTSSTGKLIIKKDIDCDIVGKDVIIIDDIVDTGVTISSIFELFKTRGVNSIEVCALLDKPEGRTVDVNVKYVGMNVPNEFVVGYGLDYNEIYRNLPYIGVLKEDVYKK